LREEVDRGQYYLPGVATGERETIVTSPIDARPDYLLRLPGPSWLPLFAGVGTAIFFLALTVKLFIVAVAGVAVALFSIFKWLWQSDPQSTGKLYDVGGGVNLADYMAGPRSHSWWAMIVLILVDGAIFASLVFSYFYLWTITTAQWPPPQFELPVLAASAVSAVNWIVSSAGIGLANRVLRGSQSKTAFSLAIFAAFAAAAAALLFNFNALWDSGARPVEHAYAAVTYTLLAWQGLHVILLMLMGGYAVARAWAGKLDSVRRSVFDNTRLMFHYTSAQGFIALLVINAPRLAG
jgi:cytochrome c oxidase subunit I+III